MISLGFFATVINYLDRQTLSVAAPILREQFHMRTSIGTEICPWP
jgi:ACS family hexuronate transporter-like MFS transporter